MATKLIQLSDGTLVEAEVPQDQARQISGGAADKVNSTLDRIQPIIVNACRPVAAAWAAIDREMGIEEARIELSLSFEGEGNVFVTKARAGANLTVSLVMKRRAST